MVVLDLKLHQESQRLDHLFKQVSMVEDEEMKAHWAKYLCVLVSGLIENTVKHLLAKYISDKSHPYISNYVNNNIRTITNLKHSKICNLIGSFSDEWRSSYEAKITEQEILAIDSVIANRHNIAHGKSVGLSFIQMKVYYQSIKRVLKILEEICSIH